ncbi:thiol reductant ABC exporter subunit CydC [Acidomonas methanolica]|uniref:ABC transporter cysteine exporter CydCD n=1 Tax=Acidomonas methanolica NBRC 104435 TaxID=1231351 RepID=A0A023D1I2_ACIMT|nr:thiol reductant ABC exporter subunit CydC [Acidomonas methanolica]MBU2652882.1 thiol reductant ABC exporter subunit CydC [Acidomonas methanolica]TCS31286.1 ATP-binding cassette subfamily C protein CydC [Acidomonas methanolica]GAJ27997.1 ABC transporter cysteine exporter CydCD [Acidomonas methanolica NBRC 104435]GBQ57662.1 transport ATP-binding protein CydD [Acidomonas methanolica]GEK98466.1 hypothetical protein AME01nite_09650 [Acidomonas methanolica NBRC 104435]
MSRMSSPRPALSASAALREIAGVWTPYRGRLLSGMAISLLALACGYLLMGSAGARLAGLVTGVAVSTLLLRVGGLGRIILRYAERLYAHDAMFRALAALRVWFYRRLAAGAAAGLGFRRAGDLLARLVGDVETLDGLYLRLALPVAGLCVSLPLLVWLGWRVAPMMGLGLGGLFLCGAVVFPLLAAWMARGSAAEVSAAESSLRVAALDLATSLREARVFGAEARLVTAVQRREEALYAAQTRQGRRLAVAGFCAGLCGQAALLLVLAALGGVLLPGNLVLGVALLFVVIAAFESIQGLTRAGLLAAQIGHAARRVVEIAHEGPATESGLVIAPMTGEIVFRDVSFSWRDEPRHAARPPVFTHLDLSVRAGERVALIGPSGAGKSSLAALLLKVAAPTEGTISFGGVPLSELDTASLRARIGWLSQATHLFDDTIRANLLLTRPDAGDESLWRALDAAEIGDFVRALPEGLDSWVGEGGARLSGGQGRRIALARTLLAETPVLVLDEPANGLDAETERAFLATLNRISRGRTVLLIAHRLVGVEQFDRILRIADGRIESVPL